MEGEASRPEGSVFVGLFDIVGGKDEEEAVAKVRAAYARERVIVSVEKIG